MENNNLTGNTAPEVANPRENALTIALMELQGYTSAVLEVINEKLKVLGIEPPQKMSGNLNQNQLKEKMIDYLREWTDDNEDDFEEKIENAVETTLCWELDWNEQQGQMSINKEVSGSWQVGYDIAEKFLNDFFYQLEQEGGAE